MFLFTFLGMGAGPLQLGKITREMPKLGKSRGVKFYKIDTLFVFDNIDKISLCSNTELQWHLYIDITFSHNLYNYFSISQYL